MALPTGQGGIDYPDGGFSTGRAIYAVTDDLGEVAARLGSPVLFDRRGSVLRMDDFEHGMNMWDKINLGGDGTIELTAEYAKTGSYSMVQTPGSSSPFRVGIGCRNAYPYVGKVGAEVSFTVSDETDYILFRFFGYDGDNVHYAEIKYDYTNKQVAYSDENLAWQILASDIDLSSMPQLFHTLKFVIDLSEKQYCRVVLDRYAWEGLSYSYNTTYSTTVSYMYYAIIVYAVDGSQPAHYFDGFILTQNEP